MKHLKGTPLRVELKWNEQETQQVGRLAERDRRIFFEYDAEFLQSASKNGAALSPFHLPLKPGVFTGSTSLNGLHGLFSDSLPDAWGQLLVNRAAERAGVRAATLTALDRLAYVGQQGMGALTYLPETSAAEIAGPLDLDALHHDATRLLSGEAADVLEALLATGGSPGGARPKVLVCHREDGQIIHGATFVPDDFRPLLVKFRAPSDAEDIGPIEAAYASMAKAAGVEMAKSELLPSHSGPGFFATERFDRVRFNQAAAGGSEGRKNVLHRVHTHTLAGLLEVDHRHLGLDYDALLRVTQQLTRDQQQVDVAFRLMVFNVLAHNRDDHAKQFSFLLPQNGEWRFAPAYDLTFCEGPSGEHSTSIAGEGRAPSAKHFVELSSRMGIQKASSIVEEVQEAVSHWPRFAADWDVSRKSTLRIQKFLKV